MLVSKTRTRNNTNVFNKMKCLLLISVKYKQFYERVKFLEKKSEIAGRINTTIRH